MLTRPYNDQPDPTAPHDIALLIAAIAYRKAWLALEEQAMTPQHTRAHWIAYENHVSAGNVLAQAALRYADAVATQPGGEERP